ncbi:MAG: hypothetical protein LBN39_04595 [Planctomycetaceae bacterium]|jgi:hypothetical protein|nr:hypothetical protein [Planctomycetaceae bacterium]
MSAVIKSNYEQVMTLFQQLSFAEQTRMVLEWSKPQTIPVLERPSARQRLSRYKPKRERSTEEMLNMLDRCPVADAETIQMQEEVRKDRNQWKML